MENNTKNFSNVILENLRTKGVSLEKLAHLTGVSERFLNLLVDEKFEKLPAAPYLRGYVLKIAGILGLDGQKLWADYLKNRETIRRSGEQDELPKNRFAIPRLSKKIFWFGILVVFIFGYITIRVLFANNGSGLTLVNFAGNIVVKNPEFIIQGSFNPRDELTLNNELVYPQKDGRFEKLVKLEPGFNTFVFKIKKLLGREYVVTKQIFYEAPQTFQGQALPLE